MNKKTIIQNTLILTTILSVTLLEPAFAGKRTPLEKGGYEVVSTARIFSIIPPGQAEIQSVAETSFRALLMKPEGKTKFKKLLAEASPEGQVYALLGLYLLDPQEYQSAAASYDATKEISVREGALLVPRPAGEILKQIEAGELY